MQFQSNHQI